MRDFSQSLSRIFDSCPTPVHVEFQGRTIYRNGPGKRIVDAASALESTSWEIPLDGGAARVVTFQPLPTPEADELPQLFRDAPVGMVLIDENLRYRRINKRLADLNGVPIEAHLGRTIADVLPHLAPFLEPLVGGVLESGEPVVDLELSGPDWEHRGKQRHTLVNFWPFAHGNTRWVQGVILEITKLKDAHAELIEQTRIFEQVHDAVIQTDMSGRIRGWNRGAEQLFGYSFQEIVGQHVSTLYFEEDRKNVDSLVLMPLFSKGQHELILRNRRKNGDECWIRLSVSLLRDATGAPTGMVGYSEDITSRLRAEKALHASEENYRLLFETSPVGIAVWSESGRLQEANDVLLRMMGWTRDQVTDDSIYWNAAKRSNGNGTVSKALQARRSGTFEEDWTRQDGSAFPVLVVVRAADNDSANTLACVIDLSQQRAAESAARENRAYLELALEGADLGVWDWNIVTGQVTFNERWATMLGYDIQEIEPHVTAWERLVHPDDLPATMAALRDHLDGRTPSYRSEHRLRSKSGEWVWILDSGKVIERSADGSPLRAAGTHLDISWRKHAELALARSEQRFHAIFDQVFQFVVLLTSAGEVLEANNTALDFCALRREGVIHRPLGIFRRGTSQPKREPG